MKFQDSFGEFVEFSVNKKFGIIRLNRPNRGNALTLDMIKGLSNAIDKYNKDDKIRGILLTGNGNSFTTGLDMDSVDGSDESQVKKYETIAAEVAQKLFYGKPVVSAINGKAMGDGVAYAICSDYRIAVKNAYFQMPEIYSGMFPGAGTIVAMSRVLGIPWTKRILMFAEKIDVDTALKIGLIDKIVDSPEELHREAMSQVRFLFTKSQPTLNLIKLCSNHLADKSFAEGYRLEKDAFIGWAFSSDKEKSVKDFKVKLQK